MTKETDCPEREDPIRKVSEGFDAFAEHARQSWELAALAIAAPFPSRFRRAAWYVFDRIVVPAFTVAVGLCCGVAALQGWRM